MASFQPKPYAEIMDENRTKYQSVYDQLKQDFPNEDDHDIIRMCMFYEGNNKKIVEAINKKREWRETNGEISRELIEEYGQSGVFFSTGKDKLGRPIAYLLMKRNNKKWDKDLVIKMMCYQMDKMIANMDDDQGQFLCMYSTDGVGVSDLDMQLFTKMLNLFSTLYPERMGCLLLYPSGWMIKSLVNGVVKNVLPGRTAEKIIPVGSVTEIFEYIDEETLIEEIGGKCLYDPEGNLDN